VLITQQAPPKEPTISGDITLEDLVRLKTEYAEYIRRSAGQPCNKIDKYLTSGAARSLEKMTPVEMSTMERIDYHINTIQSGFGGNTSLPFTTATANSLLGNLQLFYNSPTCPKPSVVGLKVSRRYSIVRYEHEMRLWKSATHAQMIKAVIKDLMKNPTKSRCQCDTGWVWVLEQLNNRLQLKFNLTPGL
jgi:hypothetical protein